jgi:hypothetical protein
LTLSWQIVQVHFAEPQNAAGLRRQPLLKAPSIPNVVPYQRKTATAPLAQKAEVTKPKGKAIGRVKAERGPSHSSLQVSTQVSGTTVKIRRLGPSNVRIADLPVHISPDVWRKSFGPTLWLAFVVDDELFDNYAAGSPIFIDTIQQVHDVVFPGHIYLAKSLGSHDPLVLLVSCFTLERECLC